MRPKDKDQAEEMVRTVTLVRSPRDPSRGRMKIVKTEVYKQGSSKNYEKVYERYMHPENSKPDSKFTSVVGKGKHYVTS
jgi:hypothetical protein